MESAFLGHEAPIWRAGGTRRLRQRLRELGHLGLRVRFQWITSHGKALKCTLINGSPLCERELREINSLADEHATLCLDSEINLDEKAGHHQVMAATDGWMERAFHRAIRVEGLYHAWSQARLDARLEGIIA